MSSLKDKRYEWEKGGIVVLLVTDVDSQNEYDIVYVVLSFNGEYALHRYFPVIKDCVISEWAVSVDISNSTLEKCLGAVSEAFIDVCPE